MGRAGAATGPDGSSAELPSGRFHQRADVASSVFDSIKFQGGIHELSHSDRDNLYTPAGSDPGSAHPQG